MRKKVYLTCRIKLIEQKIDDNARNRNIKPNGINEPRKAFMPVEIALKAPFECNENERSDQRRQDRMRCQDREINGPDQTFTGEFSRAESEIICPQRVIRNIANQEKGRNTARRDHTESVPGNLPPHNKIKTRQQKARTQRIK